MLSFIADRLSSTVHDNHDKIKTMFTEGFVEWLQNEISTRRWSQADLAREAKISREAVSGILNSRRSPGPKVCRNIAVALKISPVTVFIKAGLLPAEKIRSTILDEIDHKSSLLPATKQKIVLDLINGLLTREETESRLTTEKRG